MDTKKAIVCSIMFTILVLALWVATGLVPPGPSGGELIDFVTYTLAGFYLAELVGKFYKWLMKDGK